MARNRKRAKERRARRTDSGNGARRAGSDGADLTVGPVASDGLDHAVDPVSSEGLDPTVGPVGSEGDEGAPNPLEHASADVEIADAQVALGAPDQMPRDQTEVDREQELLEEEFAEERQERTASATQAVTRERPSLFARLIAFLQGSWRELQRVQWPDRRQVAQATGVVLGFVIVAGVFLGLCDLAFSHLMNYILK